jgi:hypothetical protein
MKTASTIAAACLLLAPSARAEGSVRLPQPWHHVNNRAHVGIPSVAVSPKNDRMWATWYAGVTPGEDSNNYVVLATSADRGQTWKEVLIADPDGLGPKRAFDPEVWVAPDGLLRWTWTERVAPLQAECDSAYAGCGADPRNDELMMTTLSAEDEPSGAPPAPVRIGRGVMMCKPIVAADGRWLFPVAHWREEPSACILSTTNGVDFVELGGATVPKNERSFDEHTLVERADGAFWMLVRTHSGLSESASKDGGRTWDVCEESGLGHPSARLFLRRLASGRLLLVKHGRIGEKTRRERLMAFLSEDDGATWQGGLMIDGRSGVSYPDGDQFADGTIVVTYDYSRTNERLVLAAFFTEEDVLAARNASGKLSLHKVISSRDTQDPDWTGVDPRLGRSVGIDGTTIWIDGRHLPREGRAFKSAPPYARLPHKLEGKLSPQAVHAGQDSAGVSFRFTTSAQRLVFEWTLTRAPSAPPSDPAANRCGIDVYGRMAGGGWGFVANGPSAKRFGNRLEIEWDQGRECRVYLPAAVGVRSFRVGVPRGSAVEPPTPVAERPVVFFGTGNFQGVAASRPGLALPSIVGRALDMPVLNLGLVGVDAVEPNFLDLLSSLDAAAYVVDSAWGTEGADEKVGSLARELRARRPSAPVIFAADFLPSGGDAMIDKTRLNDFGFVEGARACADVLRRAIANSPAVVPKIESISSVTNAPASEAKPAPETKPVDVLPEKKPEPVPAANPVENNPVPAPVAKPAEENPAPAPTVKPAEENPAPAAKPAAAAEKKPVPAPKKASADPLPGLEDLM